MLWGVVAEKHPIILDSAVQLGAEAFDSCDSSQIIEFNFIVYRGVIKVCFVQQQVNFSGGGDERRNAIIENGVCSSAGRYAAIVAFL